MATNNSDDEFQNISNTNHAKIIQKMEKMGYKDGVHDGREAQFQNGFDCGYQQGFQNGFLLGKYNGIRFSAQQTAGDEANTNQSNDLILQRCSRGQCLLCINPTLMSNSISDITERQSERIKRIEITLKTSKDHLRH